MNSRFTVGHSSIYGWCVYDCERGNIPAYDAVSEYLPHKVENGVEIAESCTNLLSKSHAIVLRNNLVKAVALAPKPDYRLVREGNRWYVEKWCNNKRLCYLSDGYKLLAVAKGQATRMGVCAKVYVTPRAFYKMVVETNGNFGIKDCTALGISQSKAVDCVTRASVHSSQSLVKAAEKLLAQMEGED